MISEAAWLLSCCPGLNTAKELPVGLSVNGLLQELRQRIRDSYEARWKAEKHFDEDQILNEMPGSLRIEVTALPSSGICNRYTRASGHSLRNPGCTCVGAPFVGPVCQSHH